MPPSRVWDCLQWHYGTFLLKENWTKIQLFGFSELLPQMEKHMNQPKDRSPMILLGTSQLAEQNSLNLPNFEK